MDSKDRAPQEDIIELIDIIEEGEGNASPPAANKEGTAELDDLEDLFLFPGAAEESRSLLDEIEDKDQDGDDDFPELDAIFEDLESSPEPAPVPVPRAVEVPQRLEPSALEVRVDSLEKRAEELAGVDEKLEVLRESVLTREAVAEMIGQAVQEAMAIRDAQISDLTSEVSALRNRLAEQERAAAKEPDMTALIQELDARIEKAVPAAAARIIREEIAGLLKG